jgi:hypothetical protein
MNGRAIRDSAREERVGAIAAFGLTERQAHFLVHVLVYAGVFVPRQYCAFAGIAHGRKSYDFVAKLVARRYAKLIETGALHRGYRPPGSAHRAGNVVRRQV